VTALTKSVARRGLDSVQQLNQVWQRCEEIITRVLVAVSLQRYVGLISTCCARNHKVPLGMLVANVER
jgi:hypothetical protein